MRSWVRISRDAAVGGIIFFKAGMTFSPGWCYAPGLVPDPGLKDLPLVPDAYSRVGNQDRRGFSTGSKARPSTSGQGTTRRHGGRQQQQGQT